MVQLIHAGQWSPEPLSVQAGVTDLQALTVGGRLFLVSTSGAYGELASWEWTGAGLALRDTQLLSGTAALPAPGGLAIHEAGGLGAFYSFGGAGRGLEGYKLTSTGQIVSLGDQGAGALTLEAVVTANGHVFGAGRNGAGLQSWEQGGSGSGSGGNGGLNGVLNGGQPVGPAATSSTPPDMAVAHLVRGDGTQDFLVTVDPQGDSVSAFRIGPQGGLTLTDSAAPANGLWINTPVEIEITQVAGTSYAVVGASDSNSVSVLRLSATGALDATDHVIDDRGTRFAGISALEVVETGDRSFVLAAGADDGITLMTLLPGGRLLGLDTLASGLGASLEDITALEAVITGNGLMVFASGEGFDGVAAISVDLGALAPIQQGTAGRDVLRGDSSWDVLLGGGGDDLLRGNGGDDILNGGAGADTLWGGAGADIFVFDADGKSDVIQDFELGVDRIDLSGMGRVYTLDAMTFEARANGARITFLGEQLDIITRDGRSLSQEDFTVEMLFDMAHSEVAPLPAEALTITGTAGNESLQGDALNDTIEGAGGADVLQGQAGADLICADVGNAAFDQASGQVVRLYQATLNRAPDAAGHRAWTDQIADGAIALKAAAAGFVNSAEFQRSYGQADAAEFVTLLYRNVLDRDPDAAGLAGWSARLDSGTRREEVVLGFSESAEFQSAMLTQTLNYSFASLESSWSDDVFRLYQATLDRTPDLGGLLGWMRNLANGMDYEDAVSGFVNSREFQSSYGTTTDAEFVTLLYRNVLDRDPDASGLAGWTARLDAGVSREEVVSGFAQSGEFIRATLSDLVTYMHTTGRDDRIEGGAGDDTLFGGALSDSFVFDATESGTDHIVGIEAWDMVVVENAPWSDADDLYAALRQRGDDVVLDLGGGMLVFADTSLESLSAEMFTLQ